MQKKIKGSDGFGNPRDYEFRILTALEGLEVIHTYGTLATNALPQLTALVTRWSEIDDGEDKLMTLVAENVVTSEGPLFDLIKTLPAIISTARLVELAKLFLTGAKVNNEECDDDGMCDLFRGRPHEVYAAIIHAVIANFPDYLPFLDSPDDMTGTKSGDNQTDQG